MINHRSPDRARPQTAKQSENSAADCAQQPTPVAAERHETRVCRLKSRMCMNIAAVLPRTWRCRPLRSEMPGDHALQQSAAQSARAGCAVSSDTQQYPRDYHHESAGYRLRRALRRFWQELRRPPYEGGRSASQPLPAPSDRMCPNPSVKAPCGSCPGCARNGFRFPLTAEEKATVREVFAHRLSENRK